MNWENYIIEKLQIDHTKFNLINRKLGFNNKLFLYLLEDEEINDNDSNLKKYVLTKQPAIYLNHDYLKYHDQEFKTSGNFPITYSLILGLINKPKKKGLIRFTQKGRDFLTNKIRLPKTILVNPDTSEITKQSKVLYTINEILYDNDIIHDELILYIINESKENNKKYHWNKVQRLNIITNEIKIYKSTIEAREDNNITYEKLYTLIHKNQVYNDFKFSYIINEENINYRYESQYINEHKIKKMNFDKNRNRYYHNVKKENIFTKEIMIYNTVRLAANENNLTRNQMYRLINYDRILENKSKFSYVLNNNESIKHQGGEIIYKIDITKMKILEVYPSIAEAARQNNIKITTMRDKIIYQTRFDNIL